MWLQNCANQSLHYLPSKSLYSRVVCEKHFASQCFTSNRKKYLYKNAIPTLLSENNDDDTYPDTPPQLPSPTGISGPVEEKSTGAEIIMSEGEENR